MTLQTAKEKAGSSKLGRSNDRVEKRVFADGQRAGSTIIIVIRSVNRSKHHSKHPRNLLVVLLVHGILVVILVTKRIRRVWAAEREMSRFQQTVSRLNSAEATLGSDIIADQK